jgi:hypothetical protein
LGADRVAGGRHQQQRRRGVVEESPQPFSALAIGQAAQILAGSASTSNTTSVHGHGKVLADGQV